MVYYIGSSLVVRWDIWGRRRQDRRVWNLHPRAGQVWLGPHLDEGGGSPVLAEGEAQRLLIQVFSFWILSLLFCLVLYPPVLGQDHIQAALSSCFFRGCTSCVKPVSCGRRQNAWVPTPSNKWSLVAGLEAKGLYDILWGTMTKPDLQYLLAHLCPWGAGGCLLLWSHAWQPKRLKFPHLSPDL